MADDDDVLKALQGAPASLANVRATIKQARAYALQLEQLLGMSRADRRRRGVRQTEDELRFRLAETIRLADSFQDILDRGLLHEIDG